MDMSIDHIAFLDDLSAFAFASKTTGYYKDSAGVAVSTPIIGLYI
jgi:hypothetical protein